VIITPPSIQYFKLMICSFVVERTMYVRDPSSSNLSSTLPNCETARLSVSSTTQVPIRFTSASFSAVSASCRRACEARFYCRRCRSHIARWPPLNKVEETKSGAQGNLVLMTTTTNVATSYCKFAGHGYWWRSITELVVHSLSVEFVR